jgi:hypothetical protein
LAGHQSVSRMHKLQGQFLGRIFSSDILRCSFSLQIFPRPSPMTLSSLPAYTRNTSTMPSHITIVPASTQAGKETISFLLGSKSKPFVRGIYRDPSKASVDFIQNANFEAVKGDVASGAGLDFSASSAVMYIPPPTFDGTDQGQFATQTALNVKKAVQNAPSVTRLLLHSSMGAQHDHGIVSSKSRNLDYI